MKRYIYRRRDKWLSEEGIVKYSNKMGRKGWRVVGILASGGYVKGKRLTTLYFEKRIKS